jgi:hypothetical protein
MFGFVKQSTYDADLAAKDAEIAGLAFKLVKEEERAQRIAGQLMLADKQAGKVPHLEAENHRLEAKLLAFTAPRERGPGGRFLKVEAQRPNGTAAAVQGAL